MTNNINSPDSSTAPAIPLIEGARQGNNLSIRLVQNAVPEISMSTGYVARYRGFVAQINSVVSVIRQGRVNQRTLELPAHFILETSVLSDAELDMLRRPLRDPVANFFLGFQTYQNQGMDQFIDNSNERFFPEFIRNPNLAYALFPTRDQEQADSGFPMVTQRSIRYFHRNYLLRNVHRAVAKMALAPFGFVVNGRAVEPHACLEDRPYDWLNPRAGGNQRNLLFQMIESLHLLGNEDLARSLCQEVLKLLRAHGLINAHVRFSQLQRSIAEPEQSAPAPAEPAEQIESASPESPISTRSDFLALMSEFQALQQLVSQMQGVYSDYFRTLARTSIDEKERQQRIDEQNAKKSLIFVQLQNAMLSFRQMFITFPIATEEDRNLKAHIISQSQNTYSEAMNLLGSGDKPFRRLIEPTMTISSYFNLLKYLKTAENSCLEIEAIGQIILEIETTQNINELRVRERIGDLRQQQVAILGNARHLLTVFENGATRRAHSAIPEVNARWQPIAQAVLRLRHRLEQSFEQRGLPAQPRSAIVRPIFPMPMSQVRPSAPAELPPRLKQAPSKSSPDPPNFARLESLNLAYQTEVMALSENVGALNAATNLNAEQIRSQKAEQRLEKNRLTEQARVQYQRLTRRLGQEQAVQHRQRLSAIAAQMRDILQRLADINIE